MSDPRRRRLLFLFPIALLVVALCAISLTVLLRGHFRRQAAVEAIRQRGGTVVFGPLGKSGWPPDVENVDLSNAVVDAKLMSAISQFSAIERLTLDGAKLRPEDYALIGKLPQLRSLSLSRTNVTDTNMSRLSPGLTSLSLNGTSVTDKSMPQLAAMAGLASLDITDTEITPAGLWQLKPLQSLKKLWVDDSCITAESVESLRLMEPQAVEVAVLEGIGRRPYEFLSVCDGPEIRGRHRDGYVLWEADSAWSDTLAGVVEAVVSEIGLDSQQAVQLLEALGDQGSWKPIVPGTPPPACWCGGPPSNSPDGGSEIESVDAFVREFQKRSCDPWAVRRFGRDRFTAGDVPKLLAAVRAAQFSKASRLFGYGPFLLIRHGLDNPDVIAELDRMLAHEDSNVQGATICAFGYGGAWPYYSRDEWASSEEADAFAVPRLLRIFNEKGGAVREVAGMVLADIAHSRPEYATEVMPALVDLLDREDHWHSPVAPRHISRVEIARLAEVSPDAAIAAVPKIREMLKQLDEQLVGAPSPGSADVDTQYQVLRRQRISVLEALSVTAHQSPSLAREIALEYLGRMRDGQPVGPFATLLSPDTPKANRMVVMELLRHTNAGRGDLESLAGRIRDWRATKEHSNE